MVTKRRRAPHFTKAPQESVSENSFEEKIDISKHIYPPIFVDNGNLLCTQCQNGPQHDENENAAAKVAQDSYFIDQPIYPPLFLEADTNSHFAANPCTHPPPAESDSENVKQVFYFDKFTVERDCPDGGGGGGGGADCADCADRQNIVTYSPCDNNKNQETYSGLYGKNPFVFGLLNIRKMDLILNDTCTCDLALQIDYSDFMYPITIVDQSEKTNKDIPFLFSVESFLFQLQKRRHSLLIMQFFIENCCFNFVFRVLNICYIPNYQATIFVRTVSNLKDLEKIIYKSRCNPKVGAHCVVCSFYVDEGRISFPKEPSKMYRKSNH